MDNDVPVDSFRLTITNALNEINERLSKIEKFVDDANSMVEAAKPLMEGLANNPLMGMLGGMMGVPDFSNGSPIDVKSIG